jgi:ribosomal peptide maturation radical SAM protein 1
MTMSARKPRVALIYPPYAPLVPPLGLALLSSGVKKLGFECRTFNWNIDFVRSYPVKQARRRVAMHQALSYLFPLNEWVFLKQVFPESDDADPRIARRLAEVDAGYKAIRARRYSYPVESGLAQDPVSPAEWIPTMRGVAAESLQRMADRLSAFDVIGISTTFSQNMAALALAKTVKKTWPEKTVVFGGANCDDVMGQTLVEQFDFIDYVFSGEVDFSFPEFVRRVYTGESTADVPGIIYRDVQGHVVKGPVAEPLEDMNALPTPDYDDYVADRPSTDVRSLPLVLALESSRGCWWGAKHHCVFCGLNANGMGFRGKNHGRFQQELEEIVDRYQPKHLTMTDNIISTSYYGEFVNWARSRRLGVDFFYEIKANLNRTQVEGLSDAGITSLQPGIESFSSNVLGLIKKGIHGIQNVAFLKYASDNGVAVYYSILGGFPGESVEDYQKMGRQVRSLVHLQPPAYGVGAAQYHRFSPMFKSAAPGFLRPLPGYMELYPFPEETIAKMAYHFEAREQKDFSYFEPVSAGILRWRESWSVRGCTLTWESVGDGILIRDRRPGFQPRNYRLTDHAVSVFHSLDRPRKLGAIAADRAPVRKLELKVIQSEASGPDTKAVADDETPAVAQRGLWRGLVQRVADRGTIEVPVSFTRAAFEQDPDASLKVLIDAGVIYVDDGSYLALPVSARRRPRQADWVNFRVPGIGDRVRRLRNAAKGTAVDWRQIALDRLQGGN